MKRAALTAIAVALAVTASAQERRQIDPLAIFGNWLGTTGAMPQTCDGDGFLVAFGSVDGKTFMMSVQKREGGVAPLRATETVYTVIPPPPTAPARVEIFLSNPEKGDLGVHVRTGSQLELVPAGADKTYPATSLFLKRC